MLLLTLIVGLLLAALGLLAPVRRASGGCSAGYVIDCVMTYASAVTPASPVIRERRWKHLSLL